jgi:hypothetical protein
MKVQKVKMVFTQYTIGIKISKTFKISFNSQLIDDLQVSICEKHQMSIVRRLEHGWGIQKDYFILYSLNPLI